MNWKIFLIAGLIFVSGNLVADKPDGKMLPFHGVFSGDQIDFDGDPEAIAERCDPPEGQVAWAIISFGGWGNATHMGETYVYAEHCSFRPEFGAPIGEYGNGIITLTADNGAVLNGTYMGLTTLAEPPIYYFKDFVTFVDGGTGRFSFASGEVIDVGSVNFADETFTLHMKGEIAYSKH